MARSTPNTVASAAAIVGSTGRLIAGSHNRCCGVSFGHRAIKGRTLLRPWGSIVAVEWPNHSASRAMLPFALRCWSQFPQLQQWADELAVIAPALQRIAVQLLPHLPVAGGHDRTFGAVEIQAARVPGKADEFQHPAAPRLLLGDQASVRHIQNGPGR